MIRNDLDNENFVFEIYKLRSVVLPNKAPDHRVKIYAWLSTEFQLSKTELNEKPKIILMDLAEKEDTIIMNSFSVFLSC